MFSSQSKDIENQPVGSEYQNLTRFWKQLLEQYARGINEAAYPNPDFSWQKHWEIMLNSFINMELGFDSGFLESFNLDDYLEDLEDARFIDSEFSSFRRAKYGWILKFQKDLLADYQENAFVIQHQQITDKKSPKDFRDLEIDNHFLDLILVYWWTSALSNPDSLPTMKMSDFSNQAKSKIEKWMGPREEWISKKCQESVKDWIHEMDIFESCVPEEEAKIRFENFKSQVFQ
ncbi:MAG TPA: hypothetical protein VIY47_06355, partial [Ignavibacteriaceae bacterium]